MKKSKEYKLEDFPEVDEMVSDFIEKDKKLHNGNITMIDMMAILVGCVIGVGIIDKGIDRKLNKLTKRVNSLEDKMED